MLLDQGAAGLPEPPPVVGRSSVSTVQFGTGVASEIEAIGALCRERSVRFYVDGMGFRVDWEWKNEPGATPSFTPGRHRCGLSGSTAHHCR